MVGEEAEALVEVRLADPLVGAAEARQVLDPAGPAARK